MSIPMLSIQGEGRAYSIHCPFVYRPTRRRVTTVAAAHQPPPHRRHRTTPRQGQAGPDPPPDHTSSRRPRMRENRFGKSRGTCARLGRQCTTAHSGGAQSSSPCTQTRLPTTGTPPPQRAAPAAGGQEAWAPQPCRQQPWWLRSLRARYTEDGGCRQSGSCGSVGGEGREQG